MSNDPFGQFLQNRRQEEEDNKNAAEERASKWKSSLEELYSNIKNWMASYDTIDVKEDGTNLYGEPSSKPPKLVITIDKKDKITITPEEGAFMGILGKLNVQGLKGKSKFITLSSGNQWQIKEDSSKNFSVSSHGVHAGKQKQAADLNEESFKTMIQELL